MGKNTGKIVREIDRTIKTVLAFLVSKVPFAEVKRIKAEQCWLIGGSVGQAYTDNSAALHQYIINHYPEIKLYWVINKSSPDVAKAKQVGPVLYREELKTYIYGLLARVHVVSHGLHDVPTCSSRLSDNALKIRLGHGLTALKQTGGSFLRGVRAKNRVFDLVPVSSPFEAGIKQSWGFKPNAIVVTGLPRFDDLLQKQTLYLAQNTTATQDSKILYMPTWRDWLPPNGATFQESDFYRGVVNFLQEPALNSLLARHKTVICLHLHLIMQHHLKTITAGLAGLPNVRVLPAGADLQDELVSSKLLITDYSSVAWDFLYLNKPVLFYQFDLEKFNQHRGAYLDLKNLFGPIAYDIRSAVELTGRFVESGFDCAPYRAMMERWQAEAFPYRDAKNCERVVGAIFKRLNNSTYRQGR